MAKKKEENVYQIKNLSEKQLRVMKDALEMYTRLGILQFDHLVDHMFNWGKNKNFSNAFSDNRDEIRNHCHAIRNLLASQDDDMKNYPEDGHWSLGIGGDKTPLNSQIAYELEKDIETAIVKDPKSKLELSDETASVVMKMNPREEKIKEIVKKIKT